ncbi:hypothetical protein IV203_010724 [Nitzschia inconspicua]|uniref:Uncharacterized protein n=1 Tax=Nitzschia inconspicua TaxID=303405 RepID=A0A9K3KWJ5_9STRA|nr:hypothetical protein IV203_010724 [Nitzschia inconspicua]
MSTIFAILLLFVGSTAGLSLKPAATPLMDSGKALARSGELLIDMTQKLDLYGGGLSAAGAAIRTSGDSIAQAAASCRFKTGTELVLDELREAATCLKEASLKCKVATEEAQTDENEGLEQLLVNMIGPMAAAGQSLEEAGAGIMTRVPLKDVGSKLVESADYFQMIAASIDNIAQSTTAADPIPEGILSAQRMMFAAEKMKEAGNELQGNEKPKPTGKAWLKG